MRGTGLDFTASGYTGQVAEGFRLADLPRELERLTDPGAALKTLHWGRNYLYLTRCETADGPVDVVVKQFRRGRGAGGASKAAKSWRVARALVAAGIATPEPLLVADSEAAGGPSVYVSRYVAGMEARYLLRAVNAGRAGELFPGLDVGEFLARLGKFVRRLHDAGVWHRDLSSGNVLLAGYCGREGGDGAAGDSSAVRENRGGGAAGENRESGAVSEAVPGPAAGAVPAAGSRCGAGLAVRGPGKSVTQDGYELSLVDLNRARLRRRLTVAQRARDLSRMNLERPEDRARLLAAYWQAEGAAPWRGRAVYGAYYWGFRWKNEVKQTLRRGRTAPQRRLVRVAHAHIPDAPAGAAVRDQAVWDRLSDQPHQHTGRLGKLRVRLSDAGVHARAARIVVGALPRVWRRYRELQREEAGAGVAGSHGGGIGTGGSGAGNAGVVPFDGAGIALRPWPEAPEALMGLIEESGARHFLLRLHPWQESHGQEEALAAELHGRGYEISFALPQNRDLVRDPARWRAAVAELGERFARYGKHFQIGQAINRSKWGVWNLGEYLGLARAAEEILRRLPGVELLGPSVIDFEYHVAIAALNAPDAGFHFDAVSALLYVDRRGAPENPQAGFDTLDKVRLLRAIADTARNAAGRCWITEVNWPLWEGPHSPAGRSVSVDEERQADYLVRYYLLALGSGLVERVFWWQLVARGYGLVDPVIAAAGVAVDGAGASAPASGSGAAAMRIGAAALRRRPSFLAFRTLLRELGGSRLEEILPAPAGVHLYRFRRPDGGDVVAGWSHLANGGGHLPVRLPRPVVRVVGRDGDGAADGGARSGSDSRLAAGDAVEVSSSPAYFHLAAE